MAPYPVCCIANVPITVLNKLLTDALAGSNDLVPGSEHELAIVVARDGGSSRVPEEATIPPLDEYSFRAYVADSVEDAAQHHVAGASYFAVLDQQSATDDTAILVSRSGHEGGEGDGTARVTFDSVQILLVSLAIATMGFAEVQSIADSQGGVYGRPTETPQRGEPAPPMRLGGN